MDKLQTLFRLVMLTGFILLLTSCTQTSLPQVSVTPTKTKIYSPDTATSTPIVANASNIGPIPKNCPLEKSLHPRNFPGTTLIGVSPVWAWPTGDLHQIVHLAGDSYNSDEGYPIKIVWELEPYFNGNVILRAGNLRSKTLLKWNFSSDVPLTTTPSLNPQHPDHPISVVGADWKEWGSEIFIPMAGCYYIEATWSTGHWRETFAAGL